MPLLAYLFELLVTAFAAWTLAYQAALAFHFPAWTSVVLFALLALLAGRSLSRPQQSHVWGEPRSVATALAVLCLLVAIFTLVNLRPDADDISFFHRALVQSLAQPFPVQDTLHDLPNLPPLSVLHVMTSYEPGIAIFARLTTADPLWMYQNGSAFLVGLLLPAIYFALYRGFGLSGWRAVACAAAAMVFLLLDGNTHGAFGNVSLVRLWQGKTILWSAGLPLVLFLVKRYLDEPEARKLAVLALAGVCSVGLSNSGVFLFPAALFCYSAAHFLANPSKRGARNAMWACAASVYCGALALALFAGWLPMPSDMRSWQASGDVWWKNILFVLGDRGLLARDALLLAVLPFVALTPRLATMTAAISLVAALCFFNPLTGPLFHGILLSAAYFRLAYILPLPFCAGLLAACFPARRSATVGAAIILVAAAANHATTLTGIAWKSPFAPKFPPAEYSFARLASPSLKGRLLLAPPQLAGVVGLTNPTVRFPITGMSLTFHLLRAQGLDREAWKRAHAQAAVTLGDVTGVYGEDLRLVLDGNVDAVALDRRALAVVAPFLDSRWRPAASDAHYVLYLRP